MALTNMQRYNTEIQTNTIELLDQMTQQFNAASGGAILLTSVRNEGDYGKEAFWNNLSSAQRRVDRYAANGAQASTSLSQGELVSVKVGGGFGPVLMEPSPYPLPSSKMASNGVRSLHSVSCIIMAGSYIL